MARGAEPVSAPRATVRATPSRSAPRARSPVASIGGAMDFGRRAGRICLRRGAERRAETNRRPGPPMPQLPSREQALALMHQHVQSESLRRHMYSVEAACRAYARRWNEDEEPYGLAGLLHDFDYEEHPEQHPLAGTPILREQGYPEEVVKAILSHYATRTGVHPETK